MGMTMQHPRLWLLFGSFSYPNVSSARCSPGYPDSANKARLITTVRVTLNSTLTKSQKRHPLPISSRGLPYNSRSRPRGCLHLEHHLFQDRFQVAHGMCLSFLV